MFKGTIGLPPTTSPPAAKGKTIYWISCGQQAPDCEAEAAAGKQAAEAIGWHVVIGDANLNQANGNQTAIRTAVAAHPDAIVEDAFSCATAEQALEAAKAANIPVLGLETLDCTVSGGPQLFTVPMIYSAADRTFAQYWQAFAAYSADYIVAASGGHAKIIANPGEGDPQFPLMNTGFNGQVAKCPGCSILTNLFWTPAALAPNGPWINSLQSALIKYPDATDVWFPFDTLATSVGGVKAVTDSSSKAQTVSGLGSSDAITLIRNGQLSADGAARPVNWVSWAAVDELNRFFNHQPAVPEGIGFVSIDKTHNLPPAGQSFQSTVPFESMYEKAWGIG